MFALVFSNLSVLFRAEMAFVLSVVLSLILGMPLINLLHKHQKTGQPIRSDGPQSHLKTKKGTPTMGGLLILGTSIFFVSAFGKSNFTSF